jgi:hypothetical protein
MAAVVTILAANNFTRNSVSLSWMDGVGNAFVRIYRNTVNSFVTAQLVGFALQGAQGMVIGGLAYSTPYYFWAVGEDAAGGLATPAGPTFITTQAPATDALNISGIKDALYDWAHAITGGRVIWEFEAGTKPAKPFVVLNLIGPQKLGFKDSLIKLGGDKDFRIEGMRSFTVSVNVFDEADAQTVAHRLQSSLDNPLYIDQLSGEKIGIGRCGKVTDLSELVETEYERRAQFDFDIFVAHNEEVTTEVIETAAWANEILT